MTEEDQAELIREIGVLATDSAEDLDVLISLMRRLEKPAPDLDVVKSINETAALALKLREIAEMCGFEP